MNAVSTLKKAIPKEIQCIDHHNNYCLPLNNSGEETGKIESRRQASRQSGRRRRNVKQPSTAHSGKSTLPTSGGGMRNRRRESLQRISNQACSEAQQFLQARHEDILHEYSIDNDCNVQSPTVKGEMELSLSELAGLLADKISEALEQGLFSFGDSSQHGDSKKSGQETVVRGISSYEDSIKHHGSITSNHD